MKIFEAGEEWSNKINFVDENNVLVGFDYSGQCCEDFGYFLSKEIPTEKQETKFHFDPEAYVFDPSFYHLKEFKDEMYDEVGIVSFKLLNKNDSENVVYLNLYNIHNGYYSHGFEISVGGSVIKSGSL